jgi:hypothetical protein
VQIHTPDNKPVEQVEVYSTQGKLVLLINSPPDNDMDLSGLPNGVYLAKIQSSKSVFYTHKIVKH